MENMGVQPYIAITPDRNANSSLIIGKRPGSANGNIGANDGFLFNSSVGNVAIRNAVSGGNFNVAVNNSSTAQMTLGSTGLLSLTNGLSVNSGSGNTVPATFNNNSGSGNMVVNFNSGLNTNTNVVLQNNGANAWYFGNTGTSGVNKFRLFNSDANGNAETFSHLQSGNTGLGQTTPTAVLHLKAGTATASTAPLKFTSGTVLTTPEAGTVEFDGTNYWVTTTGAGRVLLVRTITGTAAPATTPAAVGMQFVDTANKKLYIATGTASSADWTILN